MDSLFSNYKIRCSKLGLLMTNLPQPISSEDIELLNDLIKEKQTGKNANGRSTKWTDSKEKEVVKLTKLKNGVDELPTGAITHLEEYFDKIFYKREKIVSNKYLLKGNLNEEDALELLSEVTGEYHCKNDVYLSNSFIEGTFDTLTSIIKDTKTSYDFFTFKKSELIDLYKWQLKGYIILAQDNIKLLGVDKIENQAQLVYCLVNTPYHLIENEKKSIWFSLGCPPVEDERWISVCKQIEQNHICDSAKFKAEYPNADLSLKIFRDLPPFKRVKTFDVVLLENDKENIIRRHQMAKKYLLELEKKEIESIQVYFGGN